MEPSFLWHRHQQNLMRFSLPKAFWQHVLSMISPTKVHQPFFQLLLPGTTCPALGMLETVSFSNHRISSQEVCWIFVRWPKSWVCTSWYEKYKPKTFRYLKLLVKKKTSFTRLSSITGGSLVGWTSPQHQLSWWDPWLDQMPICWEPPLLKSKVAKIPSTIS